MNKIKKVHFVGIAGVGMSALAIYCKERGFQVSGSDDGKEYFTWKALKRAGISFAHSFEPKNIPKDSDLVVVTVAHGGLSGNPEAVAAKKMGIKTVSLAQAIGMFANPYKVIAVAGTHGKTTTAAMIATILTSAGFDPSWVPIGTPSIPTLPSHGHAGKDDWFITEADEYLDRPKAEGGRARFLYLEPSIAVVTSVEWDHPDVYPSPKEYINAFKKFIKQVRSNGLIVMFGDSAVTRKIGKSARSKIWWYGVKRLWPHLKLSVPGLHNLLDATAAARVAHELGIPQKKILSALREFKGSERRLETKGEWKGVTLLDDFAHHPTEIRMTLTAIREEYRGRRIVVLFQPHTFSRTRALLSDFAKSFGAADRIFIMDIFPSARESKGDISSSDLLAQAKKHHKNISLITGDLESVTKRVEKELKLGDVFVTMGATEVYKAHDILKGQHGEDKRY